VSFTVRRLDGTDAAAYQVIRLEGLQTDPQSFGSSYELEAQKPLSELVAQLNGNATFGAFDDQGLCAVATWYPETLLKTRHRGHVVGVYATQRARGTGAARAVMRMLAEDARRAVVQLHLVVTQENGRALRFYESLGFQIYGSDPRGLKVDGRYYDDYLMVLRLDAGGTESDNNA
jgi:ribosomal protein S18 acetylase RimI-like enzyme